jgi:voltage-gated potassium channel
LVAAESRLGFVFSFQGLVDLISIAPFYLAGVDTRAVRALRLLRVLKLQTHILEKHGRRAHVRAGR